MSADLNAAAGVIRDRFKTRWMQARSYDEAECEARVQFGATVFDPPAVDEVDEHYEWIRFTILWGDAFELTIGDTDVGENEIVGVLSIAVFVPTGSGEGELETLCSLIRPIFDRLDIENLKFGAPSAPKPGPPAVENDGWEQRVIDVPFTLEETI